MTVYDTFKDKSIDGLVEWLDKYVIDDSPWINWFDEKYCKKCKPVVVKAPELNQEMKYSWCELHDECKFCNEINIYSVLDNKKIIKLWLESEYVDEASV